MKELVTEAYHIIPAREGFEMLTKARSGSIHRRGFAKVEAA
jgi:hypothetical protein